MPHKRRVYRGRVHPAPVTRAAPVAATLLTLIAAAMWGTTFAVNDWGVTQVDPAIFVFLRFMLAGASGLILARIVHGRFEASLGRHPVIILLGLATAASFFLQYEGQALTTPAKASLLVNSGVFVVAGLSYVFLRERLPAASWTLVGIAFVGAALVVTDGRVPDIAGGSFLGDLLVLGAMVAMSGYMVLVKGWFNRRTVPVIAAAGWTFTWAAGFLLIPFLLAIPSNPLPTTGPAWLAIGYTGILCTTVAYAMWTFAIRTLSVTVSTVLLLFEVVVAVAMSWVLDLDAFTPAVLAGGSLLVIAIAAMSVLGARAEGTPNAAGEALAE